MFSLRFKRPDGTFVVDLNGFPYHVTQADPLFAAVSATAGNVFVPDEPPPPAPVIAPVTTISRRQFILALLGAGFINGSDALAWAQAGTAPTAFEPLLSQMPSGQALEARITIATMTQAERGSPLIAAVIASGLATGAQVDALFQAGATL